ncbi:MAG: amidohydrolase family protein [Azospirillaceae bacterium]
MTTTTVIRNIDWAVVWDSIHGRQAYARDVDLAFTGDRIVHVGRRFAGKADRELDGTRCVVMPGLIDIHAHPTLEPIHRGLTEDVGSDKLYGSSLYEFNTAFRPDVEGMASAMDVAIAEALSSGVTTLVDISAGVQDEATGRMVDSGIRTVVAPGFRCARWRSKDGHTVDYDWDLAAGRKTYEAALEGIARWSAHPSGRVSGMLAPMQIDTVSPDILKESHAVAVAEGIPWQIHAGQSVWEFQEITRRTGLTPVQWLADLGALDPTTIVGHAIFLDHHKTSNWPTRSDLGLLAEAGASVGHCPTIFGRRGFTLQHFGAYVEAGVNVAIGTDSYPHNILEEARHAAVYGRIAAGWVHALRTADIFAALTVNGARALGRDDLGRLAAGCQADIVIVDAGHPMMRPLRDPLKSLIFSAADRAVRDVFVAGEAVLAGGHPKRIDVERSAGELEQAQRRAIARTPDHDRLGRTAEELVPLVLPRLDVTEG